MEGGNGDDDLLGEAGGDLLKGDDGEDTLVGGAGLDGMRGGAGADTFTYRDIADAEPLGPILDEIRDFAQGQDVIDLSEIDAIAATPTNNAFSFVGTAAFTAASQVRYEKSGSSTVVTLNVDADGEAEAAFELTPQAVDLTGADFIL